MILINTKKIENTCKSLIDEKFKILNNKLDDKFKLLSEELNKKISSFEPSFTNDIKQLNNKCDFLSGEILEINDKYSINHNMVSGEILKVNKILKDELTKLNKSLECLNQKILNTDKEIQSTKKHILEDKIQTIPDNINEVSNDTLLLRLSSAEQMLIYHANILSGQYNTFITN